MKVKSLYQKYLDKEITIEEYAYKWEKLSELFSGTLSDLTCCNEIHPYSGNKSDAVNTRRIVRRLQKVYMRMKGQI